MEIRKVELDAKIETFIEAEQEKYEARNGIHCNYTPFCFVVQIGDEIIGAVSGASFFSEICIDELVVKDVYRGKGIGTQLVKAVEDFFSGRGFNNINLCTNGFQASGFYEKCGFVLEFVRENNSDPRLNKYFYIKWPDERPESVEVNILKNGKGPDPDAIHPIAGYDKEIYVKPTITNPNIIVGDFTYIADSEFESHVTHFYPWSRDKLIIGKFCQIAAGVEFVMNDANHQMSAVSTFPFYTLEGWEMEPPASSDMPFKGDTVIDNDVWIGQNAVILPGVHIGDGAIIGANSVVGRDVAPYTIVIGNPAKELRKRFDAELIDLMLRFRWWDKSVEEINALIPLLSCSDLEAVRADLKKLLQPG